jgi:hypothetical protein
MARFRHFAGPTLRPFVDAKFVDAKFVDVPFIDVQL